MMIVYSIGFAALLYAALYFLLSLLIAAGIRRLRPGVTGDDPPTVSVVVCARNEERDIRLCVEHLIAVDYPRDRLEIVLVDDESEDATRSIMEEYEGRGGVVRVLSSIDEPRDLPAKQRPLRMGIRESSGEIVLTTDADIAVRPGWVKAHVAVYGGSVGVAGGTTRVDRSSGTLYDKLQCTDLVTKHAVAMGWAGLGIPLTLMGNNMSFRRDAFDSVGGLEGLSGSIVEDMALMNAIVTRTPYSMTWIADREGVVVSTPEGDFDTFVKQRMRWIHEMGDLSLIGKVMIAAETLMLVSFLAAAAISPWTLRPLVAVAAGWLGGYALILMASPAREEGDLALVPGMIAFQMYYSAVIGVRRLFGPKTVVWKGRVYGDAGK